MRPVLDFKILLLVFTVILVGVKCQDALTGQDLLRLHQLAMSSQNGDTLFRTHLDSSNDQSITGEGSSLGLTGADGRKYDYTIRTGRSGNRRKIFHIKNPFNGEQKDETRQLRESSDIDPGASNHYSAMQYILPPEGFVNQMQNENQVIEQLSTPLTEMNYLSTVQSHYQVPSSGMDGSSKQFAQHFESNGVSSPFRSFDGSFSSQSKPQSFQSESYQSTPSPLAFNRLSTPSSNLQYMTATPAPIFASSPMPYVSSPFAQMLSSPSNLVMDFENHASNFPPYDSSRDSTSMQIDQFHHGNNGIRYPYGSSLHETLTTSPAPMSSSSLLGLRDTWKNLINNYNIMKSQESNSFSQDRGKIDKDTISYDNKVNNNLPSANSIYLNYASPGYDFLNNMKIRTRDVNADLSQPEMYSHGNYGWKLNGKSPLLGPELFDSAYSQSKPISFPLHSANYAGNSLFQTSGSTSDSQEPPKSAPMNAKFNLDMNFNEYPSFISDDFMKSTSKMQEQNKYQQSNKNSPYFGHDTGTPSFHGTQSNNIISNYFGSLDNYNIPSKKYNTQSSTIKPYVYANGHGDVVTAMPYSGYKLKQPFDHAKALKNIVPIDVSNVVYAENNSKPQNSPSYMKYAIYPPKDNLDQSIKQLLDQYKPISDSYYKDKNGGYGINIKKPENFASSVENMKNTPSLMNMDSSKTNFPETLTGHEFEFDSKMFADNRFPNYLRPQASNSYSSPLGSLNFSQQQHQDSNGMLKLNDLPYNLFPSVSDSSRLHSFSDAVGGRINQNIATHQLDSDRDILKKLYSSNKLQSTQFSIPSDVDSETGYSTFNGLKIANPFNVDMRLVHNLLKRKPEDSRFQLFKESYNRMPTYQSEPPQMLAKSEGSELGEGFFIDSSPISVDSKPFDVLAPLRAKFREADPDSLQAISDLINSPKHSLNRNFKYSRSQEEEIGILPAAEASNNYPIGAVVDGGDGVIGPEENSDSSDKVNKENQQETKTSPQKSKEEVNIKPLRHPNSLAGGRIHYPRKFPKEGVQEPYPLLKPPPKPISQSRGFLREERARRRRVNRVKMARIMHVLPLFADEVADRPVQQDSIQDSNIDSEKK